jgi:hypothetical protein
MRNAAGQLRRQFPEVCPSHQLSLEQLATLQHIVSTTDSSQPASLCTPPPFLPVCALPRPFRALRAFVSQELLITADKNFLHTHFYTNLNTLFKEVTSNALVDRGSITDNGGLISTCTTSIHTAIQLNMEGGGEGCCSWGEQTGV